MAKNRPLRAVKRRLGPIDTVISEVIERQGCARVLEVGCGLGLPMLELRARFGDRIRIVGINRDSKFNQPARALWEGVRKRAFWPWEPLLFRRRFEFPEYVNCDAGIELPFADNSFDFVYSIATTFFIPDKLNFLQEVNRVLDVGGEARIHFVFAVSESTTPEGQPPPEFDNLCEIRTSDGAVVDTRQLLATYPNVELLMSEKGNEEFLRLRKASEFKLPVRFLEARFLNEINPQWMAYMRSRYELSPSQGA